MSLQISVFDPESGRTTVHRFAHSPVRIGRDAVCELRLPFGFVSGQHAVIQFDDERAELTDPGSTNGVLREGQRLPPRQPIPIVDGLTATIGRLELQIRRLGPGDEPDPNAMSVETHGEGVAGFARIHAVIRELRPAYDRLLQARTAFEAAQRSALDAIPPGARELAMAMLTREFPAAR